MLYAGLAESVTAVQGAWSLAVRLLAVYSEAYLARHLVITAAVTLPLLLALTLTHHC